MSEETNNETPQGNGDLGVVGHTCVPEYKVSKREILQNLKMAHDNLTNRKYKNATMGIGIMIKMLEREMGV